MSTKRNEAGPHRSPPPAPPIDPGLVYPIRRLADWGFGARSVAALQRAGLETLRFGKLKFFTGASLIAVLGRGHPAGEHSDTVRLTEGAARREPDAVSGDE